jgi:hypothetical protein
MGFEITQNQIIVKQIQFELTAADLLLNTFTLPIQTTNVIFILGYVITSGGTIPLNVGSFRLEGDISGTFFIAAPTTIASQDVLYKLIPSPNSVFTPQTPETYSLNWTYLSGDGQAKVIILYSEYV